MKRAGETGKVLKGWGHEREAPPEELLEVGTANSVRPYDGP